LARCLAHRPDAAFRIGVTALKAITVTGRCETAIGVLVNAAERGRSMGWHGAGSAFEDVHTALPEPGKRETISLQQS
jgi:hypothetical protein